MRNRKLRPKHTPSRLSHRINVKGSRRAWSRRLRPCLTIGVSLARVVQGSQARRRTVKWVPCSTIATMAHLKKVWTGMAPLAQCCNRTISKKMSKRTIWPPVHKVFFNQSTGSILKDYSRIINSIENKRKLNRRTTTRTSLTCQTSRRNSLNMRLNTSDLTMIPKWTTNNSIQRQVRKCLGSSTKMTVRLSWTILKQ